MGFRERVRFVRGTLRGSGGSSQSKPRSNPRGQSPVKAQSNALAPATGGTASRPRLRRGTPVVGQAGGGREAREGGTLFIKHGHRSAPAEFGPGLTARRTALTALLPVAAARASTKRRVIRQKRSWSPWGVFGGVFGGVLGGCWSAPTQPGPGCRRKQQQRLGNPAADQAHLVGEDGAGNGVPKLGEQNLNLFG